MFSVNHKLHFVDPDNPMIHTNNIQRLWRSLKEEIGGVNFEYIDDAITIFWFRKNFFTNNFYENLKLMINYLFK
jgi:oligoendopeptidase F